MLKIELRQSHKRRSLPRAYISSIVQITILIARGVAQATPRSEAPSEAVPLSNLRQPLQILVDRWGVPHIYAQNEGDLFFAQGFYVARERLFQIDLWRRRGLGQLAEAFGPAYIEQDRAARLFLYRGDIATEWATYGPGTEQMFQQFVAGINAYIDWLDSHPDQLPFEFKHLNYRPADQGHEAGDGSPDTGAQDRGHYVDTLEEGGTFRRRTTENASRLSIE